MEFTNALTGNQHSSATATWNRLVLSVLFWLGCLLSAPGESFTWTTISGVALQSGSSDGTNDVARFRYPRGLAVGSDGSLYIADASNDTIRRLVPQAGNWISSTLAGVAGSIGSADGTNSSARLNLPAALAVDDNTNVFVLDTWNHTLRRVSPLGTNWVVSTLAGLAGSGGAADGTNSDARFDGPQGIAIDSKGNLFAGDTFNNTVREASPLGTNWVVVTIAGVASTAAGSSDGTNNTARFNEPFGVAADPAGRLYVADYQNNTIRMVERLGSNWVVTTLAGKAGMSGTNDGINNTARFSMPIAIAVDTATNLYVADSGNNLIRRLKPMGTNWVVSTVGGLAGNAGSSNGTGNSAQFNSPSGIAVDSTGFLYVSDTQNHTIRLGQPPPALGIAVDNHLVTLSWPAWATNYVLEASTTTVSGAVWSPLTNGITLSAGRYARTLAPSAVAEFFRLRE